MRKIPTVFLRDPENRQYVTEEPNPECAWVLAGEGIPTRKYDGTCVAYLDLGQEPQGPMWWARREIKPGKTVPFGFHPISTDPNTGKQMGWFPAQRDGRWTQIQEAIENTFEQDGQLLSVGTYELVGPKINGNPENYPEHALVPHVDAEVLSEFRVDGGRDFATIRGTIRAYAAPGYEGIVFHHPDGRMAKIKRRDFR